MNSALLEELEVTADALVRLDKARQLTDMIYALDVTGLTDEHFAILERVIDRTILTLSVVPDAEHRELVRRLSVAREGIEQGMAADPAKRPSLEEMRQFVADHL